MTNDLRQIAPFAACVILGAAIFATGALTGSGPRALRAATTSAASAGAALVNALALYDDNGNVAITCAEARAHGIAPVRRDHPTYAFMRDSNDDGVVCG
ncbi:MAG: excalibur calcium-binding domain-containing protein [Gemmatimonadetes bacterium]|nr:excalibur calcium-binding domain-containing protein [Gemmatimonadota bacterium]MYB97945.1 excalibur calcium-binding domain-containing protein [Gemmatimonadota bacterium]MYI46009.1 excalibur calcium-binding domain-containing protein [Gemmatimonadota bacterium]